MREALPVPRSILVCALGIAGNQVLPLSGGDAVRVVLSRARHNARHSHAAVSALAVEKLFDLVAVAWLRNSIGIALVGAHEDDYSDQLFSLLPPR